MVAEREPRTVPRRAPGSRTAIMPARAAMAEVVISGSEPTAGQGASRVPGWRSSTVTGVRGSTLDLVEA